MEREQELEIKKNIYVQLAFALYGTLIACSDQNKVIIKSAAFTASPSGKLFLIIHQAKELDPFNFSRDAIFTIIKEGSSVTHMYEIKFKGFLSRVEEHSSAEQQAKDLFDKKSPYLSTVPFIDTDQSFMVLSLNPHTIYFQNIKEAREGSPPFILSL